MEVWLISFGNYRPSQSMLKRCLVSPNLQRGADTQSKYLENDELVCQKKEIKFKILGRIPPNSVENSKKPFLCQNLSRKTQVQTFQ